MVVKYYRVREKRHPDNNGLVVKVEEGKLENLTGSSQDLEKCGGCFLDNKGNLKTTRKYFITEIDKVKADKLESDYDSWIKMQLYMGTDPGSIALKEKAALESVLKRRL